MDYPMSQAFPLPTRKPDCNDPDIPVYATAVMDAVMPPPRTLNKDRSSRVILPKLKSKVMSNIEINAMREQGFTTGLARAMTQNNATFPLRIWVIDNSGSMNRPDGHRLVESATRKDVKVVSCTRWTEIQQTVDYHVQMAALLQAPTVFRLLNDPGRAVGPQQFSVCENGPDNLDHEVALAQSVMLNATPAGVTPLVAHSLGIRQNVLNLEPPLRQDGTKVANLLATDGVPTDGFGPRNDRRQLQDHEVPERTNYHYFNSSDFFELVCYVVIILIFVCVSVVNTVHQRPIPFQLLPDGSYVENQVNSQNLTGETIPDWLLLLLSVIAPLLFQLALSKFYGSTGDMHSTASVYVLGLGLTYLTVEFVKLYVGYPRPNFYSMCKPSANYSACTAEGSDSGRKAFPSGHAAIAFCGLSLLTFFIQHRFGVPSQPTVIVQYPDGRFVLKYTNGPPRKARVYSILSLAPMALATFIAASRVHDNMHFPADVVGGAVLGTALSFFFHSLWFPSLPK